MRNDANAFNYSLLATVSFGLVQLEVGSPTTPRLFLFVLGATGVFALAEAASSNLFREQLKQDPSDVILLGTALGPVSVSAGLGAGVGTAHLIDGALGWFLVPLVVTGVYVAMTGVQLAYARHHELQHPPDAEV